jgi:hypothetical protein
MKFYLLPLQRVATAVSGRRLTGGKNSMSDIDTRTKRAVSKGELFPDRATMIVYLEYALEELAELDEVSASLIQMAILNLRGSDPQEAALNYTRKLS